MIATYVPVVAFEEGRVEFVPTNLASELLDVLLKSLACGIVIVLIVVLVAICLRKLPLALKLKIVSWFSGGGS